MKELNEVLRHHYPLIEDTTDGNLKIKFYDKSSGEFCYSLTLPPETVCTAW